MHNLSDVINSVLWILKRIGNYLLTFHQTHQFHFLNHYGFSIKKTIIFYHDEKNPLIECQLKHYDKVIGTRQDIHCKFIVYLSICTLIKLIDLYTIVIGIKTSSLPIMPMNVDKICDGNFVRHVECIKIAHKIRSISQLKRFISYFVCVCVFILDCNFTYFHNWQCIM